MKKPSFLNHLTLPKLTLIASFFLVTFYNIGFFKKLFEIYPVSFAHLFFLVTLYLVYILFFNVLLQLTCFTRSAKPILIITFVTASIISYFSNHFGVVMGEDTLLNIINSDIAEVLDLLSFKMAAYFLIGGLLPAFLVYHLKISNRPLKTEVLSKVKIVLASLFAMVIGMAMNGSSFAAFFRQHKPIRYYSNPTYMLYSSVKFLNKRYFKSSAVLEEYGRDSDLFHTDVERELVVFVVGETARADHFSLNGYKKETNPLLKKEDVISFKNVESCGTSTAISVPCMFSHFTREEFSEEKARNTENLLDILQNTKKVKVLWRDNNSDSKGVADRIQFEDFKSPQNNPICDIECRDEGMLSGLDKLIETSHERDIFIVLHQMGSHGPAYFKRYPKAFEKFKPACKTGELGECTVEEINNAYDNTILYTDYFLSKVINLLKKYSDRFETAMIYASDHGESLGENGVYLHGFPHMLAPAEQKNSAMIFWLEPDFEEDVDIKKLKSKQESNLSHDYIFHSILGLVEVNTKVYDKNYNLFENDDDFHTDHSADIK